jgi:nucleoside-diphosphate-sugar epimerase
MNDNELIVDKRDLILITGANGFIGINVVKTLVDYGFPNLRCFVKPSSNLKHLEEIIESCDKKAIEVFQGNLLSPDDCRKATQGVSLIFHLAVGAEKSFSGSFMNSVVTTSIYLILSLEVGH